MAPGPSTPSLSSTTEPTTPSSSSTTEPTPPLESDRQPPTLEAYLGRPSDAQPPPFLTLPLELHRLIVRELKYPDLLSLKLSHPYFQGMIGLQPTIHSRIQWLMSRSRMALPVPQSTGLSFLSDVAFVANPEVKGIMNKRRRHHDCLKSQSAREMTIKTLGWQKGRTFCFVLEASSCPWIQGTSGRRFSWAVGSSVMELLRTWKGNALALLEEWVLSRIGAVGRFIRR